jgi:hypothetical protein
MAVHEDSPAYGDLIQVQKGDVVCVFLGSDVPMLLSQAERL